MVNPKELDERFDELLLGMETVIKLYKDLEAAAREESARPCKPVKTRAALDAIDSFFKEGENLGGVDGE